MQPRKTSTDLGHFVETIRKEISLAGRSAAALRSPYLANGQYAMIIERVAVELPVSITLSPLGPRIGNAVAGRLPGQQVRITVILVPKTDSEENRS